MNKPAFFAPAGVLDLKPRHGQPCNNCGMCCVATLCPLARRLFGRELGPCPALLGDFGSSKCGVVADPAQYDPGGAMLLGQRTAAAAAAFLIGTGTGCDVRFNGEPPDKSFYARLRVWDRMHEQELKRARKLWAMEER